MDTHNIGKFDQWVHIEKEWEEAEILHDDIDFKKGNLKVYERGHYFLMVHVPIKITNALEKDFRGLIKARLIEDKIDTEASSLVTQTQSILIPSSIIPGEVVLSLQGFLNLTEDDVIDGPTTIRLEYLCNTYDNISAVPEGLKINVDTELGEATWTCLRL